MRIILLILTILCFTVAPSLADIYQWTDKDGLLHMADDMHKVPEEYRANVRVIKTGPAPERKPAPPAPPPKAPAELRPEKELYGDEPLEWWVETFKQKNQEISALQSGLDSRRKFIEIFDSGRRLGGVTYGPEDIETYERYKEELLEIEGQIRELEDELAELRRKARIYGVPREIRQ